MAKKITADIVKTVRPQNAEARISPSTATYSISDIIPFVNTEDLLRYLPDDMLTDSQKDIKWDCIAETIKYTNGNHPLRDCVMLNRTYTIARVENTKGILFKELKLLMQTTDLWGN